jgi:PAS domain S-box-containing protein
MKLDKLKKEGVSDFRRYFEKHPELVNEYPKLIKVLDVNEETLKIYGAKDKAELLGSFEKISVPEALPFYKEQFIAIAEGKTRFESVVPARTLQGKHLDVLLTISFPEETSEYKNMIVSIMDITERKQIERELQKSEERYRAIFETAKVSLWEEDFSELMTALNKLRESGIKDFKTFFQKNPEKVSELIKKIKVLDVNQETVRLYKANSKEELLGSLEKVSAPESFPVLIEQFTSMANGRSYFESEMNARTLKGDLITVLLSVIIPVEKEEFKRLIVTIMDVTERRRLEREFIQSQKLESIGLLAGGIAHDFNNILTSVLGNISLIRSEIKSDNNLFKMLHETEKAVLHARSLSKQLLTFSKGGAPVKKTLFITNLLKEATSFALRGSKICYNFSIPDNLWQVEADEGQINQAINNLVINARQAMPEGGEIIVKAENIILAEDNKLPVRAGRYVKVTISDQGIGIHQKDITSIFDPYFSTKPDGSGLGLTAVYSIVKAHAGHIGVESELGVGTSFCFYLPAISRQRVVVQEKEGKEPDLGFNKKVLLLDDDELVLQVAGRMLEKFGCNVDFAVDGNQAIKKYREAMEGNVPFDLAIMDLTIPGKMGGREALAEIYKIDPEVKAIVSSGYSSDPVMSAYQEYGFKGVIAKPYTLNELQRVLTIVLDP